MFYAFVSLILTIRLDSVDCQRKSWHKKVIMTLFIKDKLIQLAFNLSSFPSMATSLHFFSAVTHKVLREIKKYISIMLFNNLVLFL